MNEQRKFEQIEERLDQIEQVILELAEALKVQADISEKTVKVLKEAVER